MSGFERPRPDLAIEHARVQVREAKQLVGQQAADRQRAGERAQLLDLAPIRIGLDRGDERGVLREIAKRVVEGRARVRVMTTAAGPDDDTENRHGQEDGEPAHPPRG
jgi:hypothetical protein